MALAPGDAIPGDLVVADSDGRQLTLSSFRGAAALLIYLRHLA